MKVKEDNLEKAVRRSRMWTVLWFCATLFFVAIIVVLLFFGWWMRKESVKTNNGVENIYRHNFYELLDSMNSLEVALSKLKVVDGGKVAAELTLSCYRQAEIASIAISVIPIDSRRVENTEKFLNQVADWSKNYNLAISDNGDISRFSKSVDKMLFTVKIINFNLAEGQKKVDEGYSFRLNYGNVPSIKKDNGDSSDKKENVVEYPELIYDGPFSDSLTKKSYKALENLEDISASKALELAKDTLKSYAVTKIEASGISGGDLATYNFVFSSEKGDGYINLTKKGGVVIGLDMTKEIKQVSITEEQAASSAKKYLESIGYNSLDAVWTINTGGICSINFAPTQNGAVFYTDLIKVKVALDDGQILGLEVTGYTKNHTTRDYKARISQQEAKKAVSGKIDIATVKKAVVPVGAGEELCYEFSGKLDNLDYFIYVSAKSGKIINVFRVIDTNQGRLVI